MKRFIYPLLVLCLMASCSSQGSLFILKPLSTMSITGKGVGQDAAINPYLGQACTAMVKNLSDNSFEVRIEEDNDIISIVEVKGNEDVKIDLKKNQVLFLDALSKESKARVTFKKVS